MTHKAYSTYKPEIMQNELSQQTQQQTHSPQDIDHGARKRNSLPWIIALLVILAITSFIVFNKDNDSSTQTQVDTFFTLNKIVRTDLPDEKLAEYKNRMSDAKANATAPGGEINFRSYMEAGSVKKGVGDYEGARDIWEFVNSVRPKNSVSFANLGDLYANFLNNNEKAEANYLKAIENDPSDPSYVRSLLELYQYRLPSRLGFQESLFKNAAEKNESNPEFWLILANYYELAKNYDKAIESWKEVASIDPNQQTTVDAQIDRLRRLTK